ncbi:MAG: DUF5686 and carboxypeptidase regulatory-like domain-containing protein [Paludibacteraceae bacterium]|nr:DUF5686 and carboxypeptidase regulatory-like domain-containing protein [Paludibacteraceae bacterium]
MRYSKTIILLLLILSSCGLSARDIVVIGQVMSADSVPLPAANVWFSGTKNGGITNDEGFFYLRSNEPQRSLVVSVVGYKRKTVRLDYGHDQMLNIFLDEDYLPIDAIVVRPDNRDALRIINNVYKHRKDTMLPDFRQTTTHVNLTDIPNRIQQRRLFNDIKAGLISHDDSTYSLPAYYSVKNNGGYITENFLPVMDREHWHNLISNFSPSVNLYNSYVTILGYNFLSPITRSSGVYYNVYLLDSTFSPQGKTYRLQFKPKSTNGLYLQGTIDVDSTTWRITASDIKTSPYTNINILNSFCFSHNDTTSSQALSLGINPLKIKNVNILGAMVFEDSYYSSLPKPLAADSNSIRIDSIKDSKLVRAVKYTFDLLLAQHIHAGPIDIGPIFNLFHYNKRDGATPQISLRTNQHCLNNVSFGGYFGYAHKAKQMLYGGNVKFRTSDLRHHWVLGYDHKSYKYGFDDTRIFDENNINDADNLMNSLSQIKMRANNDLRTILSATYNYETKVGKTDFRFGAAVYAQRVECDLSQLREGSGGFSNIDNVAVKSDVRLAWKQRCYESYFQRYYFNSTLPVVHIYAESGYFRTENEHGHYGKLGVYAEQKTPVGFGRLTWTARASGTFGTVPFSLLDYIRTSRGSLNMVNDFTLLNQLEFASDALFTGTLRYQTHGYLFGYIPGIKRLGIREDIYLNIGYGVLVAKSPLPLHSATQPWGDLPYIECGFGLSNLLSFFKIQFMFRCTYRENPDAQLFSVKWAAEF